MVPVLLASDATEEVTRQGAVLRLHVDKTSVAYSETIQVTISLEGTAPLEVEPIAELTSSRLWEERPLGEPEVTPLPRNRSRWKQVFRLGPLQPEKTELAINPLRFHQGKDPTWIEQPWKPIAIQVTTDVTAPGLNEARDITPIRTLPEPPGWRPWLLGGGAGLAALIFLLLGLGAWRRARREVALPPLTPPEWAIRELELLEAMELAQSREVERYHTLLSNVLRHYLERRFGLHAPEQTTAEFLESLRRSSLLPARQQELLRDFLGRCDLAKFARADFSVGECQVAVGMAREFIEQTAVVSPESAPKRHTGHKEKP